MKCSSATQSPNLIIEIYKVICMDIGVYGFNMCLYVYICLYRYVLFALVCVCSYLHIFTYSFGFYRGLIRLCFVFWSLLSLHCYKYQSFYILWVFFLKWDLIPKLHLLKPNASLSMVKRNDGSNGSCGQGLR